ncbi:MAG: hypothetical protein IPM82_13040 [Saprospiraceae bacterium]|nr:hypothetical protein [Saprospiraceae bacterium]
MENLLDNEPIEKKVKKTFSKVALAFGIFSLTSLCFHGVIYWFSEEDPSLDEYAPEWLMTITNGTIILGVIASIISLIKKEPSSFAKWAGFCLNAIFVILYLSSHLL